MSGDYKLGPGSFDIFTYYLLSINFVHNPVLIIKALAAIFFFFSKKLDLFNKVKAQILTIR